jgi:hypothetical protein
LSFQDLRGDYEQAKSFCNTTDRSGDDEQRSFYGAGADFPSSKSDWNTPPAGTEQAQQGYRDGIMGAKLDKLTNRKIGAKTSHMYLHPPVKSNVQADYRVAFIAGYEAAVKNGASYPAS